VEPTDAEATGTYLKQGAASWQACLQLVLPGSSGAYPDAKAAGTYLKQGAASWLACSLFYQRAARAYLMLKVHKREKFFGSDFEFFTIL
jgi:hypothetical protein